MKFFLLLRWKLSFLDTLQDSTFAHMKKFIKSVHLWLLWKTTEMLNCHQSNWNCLSDIKLILPHRHTPFSLRGGYERTIMGTNNFSDIIMKGKLRIHFTNNWLFSGKITE